MSDNNVQPIKKTPRQIAEEEIAAELNKDAVKRLKEKLRQLNNARQIVKNLENEVDELEHEIDNGL